MLFRELNFAVFLTFCLGHCRHPDGIHIFQASRSRSEKSLASKATGKNPTALLSYHLDKGSAQCSSTERVR
jgi:hypothetical protein